MILGPFTLTKAYDAKYIGKKQKGVPSYVVRDYADCYYIFPNIEKALKFMEQNI